MKEKPNPVNKKLLQAVIAYSGMSLEALGRRCDPPVTKSAISYLLSGATNGRRLKSQIVDVLSPHVPGLLSDLQSFNLTAQTANTEDK